MLTERSVSGIACWVYFSCKAVIGALGYHVEQIVGTRADEKDAIDRFISGIVFLESTKPRFLSCSRAVFQSAWDAVF